MDHRLLLAIVYVTPLVLASLVLLFVEPRWQPFIGHTASALGAAATILPASIIAARMLRAIPEDKLGGLVVLNTWLVKVAQEPRRWHYWLLFCGLVLVLTGATVSTWLSWP